jgi:hypothetical protein
MTPLGSAASHWRSARARRHNELRRRTDRQRCLLKALLALALTVVLAMSAVGGVACYRIEHLRALRNASHLHVVQAVALSSAVPSVLGAYFAPVRWTDGTGAPREVDTEVSAATMAGDHVGLLLDAEGNLAAVPFDGSLGDGLATGVLVLCGAGTVVMGGSLLLRRRLDRTDQRNWELEWEQTEPAWSHRRL